MHWARRITGFLTIGGVLAGRAPAPVVSVIVPLALASAGIGLRLALAPWLAGAQFVTLFPAVILATLLSGAGGGALALALSGAAAALVFIAPDPDPAQVHALLLFFVVGLMDVAVVSALLASVTAARAATTRVGELAASLAASEARFRDVIETAPDAMVIADVAGSVVLVNAAAERMFGYSRRELLGRGMDMLIPPRFRAPHQRHFQAYLAAPEPRRMGEERQLFGLHRSGREFPIETSLAALSGDGSPLVLAAIRDVSWRREGERRRALLMRELNHRVKNTLASVQAIVTQTLRAAQTPSSVDDAVSARLQALAQSHNVLTRSDWSGAEIHELVREQLSPYETGGSARFRLEGPEIRLSPNRAVSLGMALGELATNAAKYGALSAPGGTIEVVWTRSEDSRSPRLRLLWTEVGGPGVRPPDRRGFGSRLIERSVTAGLLGDVGFAFEGAGLRCEITFPLLPGES